MDAAPILRSCAGCDAELVKGERERNPRKWCSPACRQRHIRRGNHEDLAKRREVAKVKADRRRTENPPPPCIECGSPRIANRGRYCNQPKCQSVRKREWRRSQSGCTVSGCENVAHTRTVCASHYSSEWRASNRDKVSAINARRRARKRDAFVEDVDPALVYERDQWTCHICGQSIPSESRYPDPLSPSVDHVVPLSRGGEHSYLNCKASHYLCNARKSNSL